MTNEDYSPTLALIATEDFYPRHLQTKQNNLATTNHLKCCFDSQIPNPSIKTISSFNPTEIGQFCTCRVGKHRSCFPLPPSRAPPPFPIPQKNSQDQGPLLIFRIIFASELRVRGVFAQLSKCCHSFPIKQNVYGALSALQFQERPPNSPPSFAAIHAHQTYGASNEVLELERQKRTTKQ